MVSALLLTGLFFKLGIEQRMREIGVLRALGFSIVENPRGVSAGRRGSCRNRRNRWDWQARWPMANSW
jgi:hypothetical protein